MADWKEIIKKDERYKGFTLLDKPESFNKKFKDVNIDCVQLHSIATYEDNIVGFCGSFQWNENIITPLDGDTYSDETLVYGYEWFNDTEGNICIDILVDEW